MRAFHINVIEVTVSSPIPLRYNSNSEQGMGEETVMSITHRFLFYVIGLFILTLGISMTIVSGLGTSPFDALNVGLSKTIGLTVGSWEFLNGLIMLFINALISKGKPDFLALLTALLTGIGIDIWLLLMHSTYIPSAFIGQFIFLLGGVVIIGLGIATYLQADFAPIPVDGLMIALKNRLHISLAMGKLLVGAIMLVLAFIFNGPINWGTILVLMLAGPSIGLFYPKLRYVKEQLYLKSA